MKKIVAILLLCNMGLASAAELNSFNEISNSVQQGKNIKLVIHFDLCSPKPAMTDMVVYTTPTAIMIFKDHLQFANSPLTTNDPTLPGKPILQNYTYKIDNNEVNIDMKTIRLPDYVVASEKTIVCPLGAAVKIFN